MKSLIAAALAVSASISTAQAQVDLSAQTVTVGYLCRDAIYAELYQSRLRVNDQLGAVLLIREGGCQPVPAGSDVIVIDNSNLHSVRVMAPVYGMSLPGYLPREVLPQI